MCQPSVIVGSFVILQGISAVLGLIIIIFGSIHIYIENTAASRLVLVIGLMILAAQSLGFVGVIEENTLFVWMYTAFMLIILIINSCGVCFLTSIIYDVEVNWEKWLRQEGKMLKNETPCGKYGTECIQNLFWLGSQEMIVVVNTTIIVFSFIFIIVALGVAVLHIVANQ